MALKDFERFISSDEDIIYHHTKSRTTCFFNTRFNKTFHVADVLGGDVFIRHRKPPFRIVK